MKKILLSTLLAFVISLIPVAAMAVEYGGVGGRPANPREDNARSSSIFIYELEPGESYKDGVEVFNSTEQDRTIELAAVDSVLASDGAFSCAQNAESKVDVGKWIELESESVTIAAGESEVVNFTVTVPKDASVGEHSGCVTIQDTQKQASPEQGGVVLTFRSAIRVAVTIPGEIVKAVTVSNVSLQPNSEDANLYTIQPAVVNTGNVSLDTTLSVRLVSLFGTTIDSKDATYPVLPTSTAKWNFDVNKPFWGGLYRADVTATYNGNTADSLGEESEGAKVSSSKSSSYVFVNPSPVALAIEIGLLLVIIVLAALLVRKLRHRGHVQRHWGHYTVQDGDSLQKISKHYGVSWKKLATANKVRAPYHLEPGSKLKVPPKKQG